MFSVSQARSLRKYFLIMDNMLVVMGFYIVFPFISIYFIEQLGWTALTVGIALGLRQLIQQGLGIFSGACADKLGAKPMIVSGMLMRAIGFIIMSIANTPWLLWLACILSALGGTLFDPPRTALIMKLIRPWERGRFYSLLMLEDSVCAIVGTSIGSWLLKYNFKLVCLTGAILFIIAAIFNAWQLPAYRVSTINDSLLEGIKKVLRDHRFVTYVLTLTGYYMLSIQVMLMLPIRINEIAGQPSAVKWMYAIEATLSLLLLYPISCWSEKRFKLETRLMTGLTIMLISLFPIGLIQNLRTLLSLISLFYIGSIIAEPARETLGASLVDHKARSSYMGFSRLGLALGGVIGYSGSGWLYDIGNKLNIPELPWCMLGFIGMITLFGLYYQFQNHKIKTSIYNKNK
ncbi:multidrug efflux MFS transporter MdtH [Blochmannia endosymbiont of Camponotus (Colobopsis) obliquus]|uniref:multidrug efflux MFS transporter MdtH n=1 Tax=Blochmannia endosymbiont of Camponotus (Colobopsis) obliquus TaxID=1505597 RepID=UPI00061A65C7|nr:multidrug efflux MFS transporter MdtH [Blochmannia endosymbiont of Camponotus (Colobopsis) obliquus]AKC60610.1 Multidrug resistance protein MdtH [Blochmannia endosymbiont of Camponotus (Colobopsis) obliquus]